MHRHPSLSTKVLIHGCSDGSGQTILLSLANSILGEHDKFTWQGMPPHEHHKEREKKEHYIQIKIIHIKMKRAPHVDACVKNMCNEDKASLMWGPWLRVILLFHLLVRRRNSYDLDAPLLAAGKLRLVSQLKNEGACRFLK